MGPGPLELLEMIEKEKSINKAAKKMGLSYVKALRMLKRLEEDAGQKILIKRTGGVDGGGIEVNAAPGLGDAERHFANLGLYSFGLVTIRMAFAAFGTLVGTGVKDVRPFDLHRLIEHDTKDLAVRAETSRLQHFHHFLDCVNIQLWLGHVLPPCFVST